MTGNPIYPKLQICAGGTMGKNSCGGDSWGGLFKQSAEGKLKGRYKLIGIVSWGGTNCGARGKPGVYVRVSAYLPWILDNLRKKIHY